MSEVYVAARWSDGSVSHEAIQLVGRFPALPKGNWRFVENATWVRDDSDENIEYELSRTALRRAQLGEGILVGWRRISADEHEVFNTDREYRNALVDQGGKLVHDMTVAKELRRQQIRVQRSGMLPALDAEWMKAVGQKNQKAADDIEAQRQVLRDAPADIRIDSATTVEELKTILVA